VVIGAIGTLLPAEILDGIIAGFCIVFVFIPPSVRGMEGGGGLLLAIGAIGPGP
jgi:hypothetical protein